MCIVADDIVDVSKTRIASFHVAYSVDNGKTILPSQLVVYATDIESITKSNALILPIYNPNNDYKNIIPLDFSDLTDFFNDVKIIYNKWFPSDKHKESNSYTNLSFNSDSELLSVHTVGDYKFSIMPKKIDFNRIDRSQLNISPMARAAIDVHSDEYSFIVYQFYQKGNVNISPFAYLCKPCMDNAMVIPTIHGHSHNNSTPLGLGYVNNVHVSFNHEFENISDYDHEIYTLVKHSEPNKINKKCILDINDLLKNIKNDYMERKIRIYVPKSFVPNLTKIKGNNLNRNLMINIDGCAFINDLIIQTKYLNSNASPVFH